MSFEVPCRARACSFALLTSSGWSSGLPLPHIPPAIFPPAVSVSETSVWSRALPDEKPIRGTGTAVPSDNPPVAGEKSRTLWAPGWDYKGHLYRMESSWWQFRCFYRNIPSCMSKNIGHVLFICLWWFILIVSFMGSSITLETSIWACLWRIIYTRGTEVGRSTLNLGSSLPQAGVLDCIERKKASWAQAANSPFFQAVDAMWPVTLCSCCHDPCGDHDSISQTISCNKCISPNLLLVRYSVTEKKENN